MDGRVEGFDRLNPAEWEMNSRPPSFHPSILPAAESVKRFLKHAYPQGTVEVICLFD